MTILAHNQSWNRSNIFSIKPLGVSLGRLGVFILWPSMAFPWSANHEDLSTYKARCIGVLRGDLITVDYMLPSAVCVVVVGACLHNEYWELFWNIWYNIYTKSILIRYISGLNFGRRYLKMVDMVLLWSRSTIKWLGSLQTKILS